MESNIDKMYNDMLKIADSVSQNGELSEEDAAKMQELSDQVSSTNYEPSPEETSTTDGGTKVMGKYNPETGEIVDAGVQEAIEAISNRQWDSFNNEGSDSTSVNTDILKGILGPEDVKDFEDISALANLISRRLKGENFNPYDLFPETYKREVDKLALSISNDNINPNLKGKNYIANAFLNQLVNEYKKSSNTAVDLDTMLSGFDKEVDDEYKKISQDLGGMMMTFDDERRAEIDAAIKRCEAEGKTESIDRLNAIKNTLDTAYNLTEFAEACKYIKIKRYELENPKRVWESFNFKYEKHKNVINDISQCPTILMRHIPEYTDKQKTMLCIAFCKYCLNFSPDNMEEHTFMYYFIRNIIMIDRLNPKGNLYESMDERSKTFYDGFVENLKACIVNISDRNSTLL